MNIETFKDLIAQPGITVAYFSHDACNVCKVLKPQVRDLAKRYENVRFQYVNTVDNPEIGGQYIVFAVPTIVLFAEGREARRYSRNLAMAELEDFLNRMTA